MPTPELNEQPVQSQVEQQRQVDVREQQAQVSPEAQELGVSAIPVAPAPVTDDQGQVIAQPQAQPQGPVDDSVPTIYSPADEATLHKWKKGPSGESRTWLATFLDRMIESARFMHQRVRLVIGKKPE